jgi:hypothetical protein
MTEPGHGGGGVAGHTGRTVRSDAEARRIAAEFGLGRHVKVWRRGSKVTERALLLAFLIGLPVVTVMLVLTASQQMTSFKLPYAVALGVVMSLPAVIGWRSQWPVLHEFEGGLANVSRHRRQVSVVRWSDLAAVAEDWFEDEDGRWHSRGYVLEDRAGHTVELGKRAPELVARAHEVLAVSPSRSAY